VLKLTYKNISILFTGDITSNTEKELLNKNIESTVLKVAHHGSKYSNSAAFLRKVNPKYAVISCGINNEYFHPHQVVLDKLEKLNTKVYRTDLLGTIVLESDGESISFKNIDTDTDGG
jgi:competence protein ComEC